MLSALGMEMRSWAELWHHFTAVMAQAPVAVVLAVWVGLALVLVMALEGFLLNLFPACVFHRYLEKMPERKKKSAALPTPVPAPTPVAIAAPPPAPIVIAPPPVVPPPVGAAPPPADVPAAPPAAKSRPRKARNPKKPAPGPKPGRAATARRMAPRRERLSRGTPRLLAPKN